MSSIYDHDIKPHHYETADEREHRILLKIIILQSYWRRWLAKRVVKNIRNSRAKFVAWKESEVIRKKKADADEKEHVLQRRLHPSAQQDFDLLLKGIQGINIW